MPIQVKDIATAMEAWAPKEYAYDWDSVGLHIGTLDANVKTLLCCLSVDETTLQIAKKMKAQMIVSHHPMIFRPLKNLCGHDPHTALCLAFHDARIAVYSAHTNLDIVPNGVNAVLANSIGLQNTRILFPARHAEQLKLVVFVPDSHLVIMREALSQAGAGVIGNYTQCSFSTPGVGTFVPNSASTPFSGRRGMLNEKPEYRLEMILDKHNLSATLAALHEAHPYEEAAYDIIPLGIANSEIGLGLIGNLPNPISLKKFTQQLCSSLQISHLRYSGEPLKKVSRVAVMGGAGGSEVGNIPADVDVFVTGDVKYHNAIDAVERGLAIVDAGHWGTEKGIVPVMAQYLRTQFKEIMVKSYIEPDIFRLVTE